MLWLSFCNFSVGRWSESVNRIRCLSYLNARNEGFGGEDQARTRKIIL